MSTRRFGPGTVTDKKTKDGRYVGRWRTAQGKTVRKGLAATKRDSYRLLAEIIRQRDAVLLGTVEGVVEDRAVSSAIEEFMRRKERRVGAGHAQEIRSVLERLVKEAGAVLVTDLDCTAVEAYLARRKDEGAANRTLNKHLSFIRQLLRHVGAANVLDVVESFPSSISTKVRVQRALRRDEMERLMATIREHFYRYYPSTLFLQMSGCRWSEMRNLSWRSVSDDVVTLRNTKNGTHRVLPISEGIRQSLELTPTARDPLGPVFAAPRGRRHSRWTSSYIKYCLDPALRLAKVDRVNIDGEVFTVHGFRHTFCTRLAEAGVPIQAAQALTGHRRLDVLIGIYTHVSAGDLRADLERATK